MGVASCRCVRPDFTMSSNAVPLASSEVREGVERAEHGRKRGQHREPHRRGDHVVGALGHVDVIVRMDRRVDAARLAEDLVGAVREDFVNVHVVARARARLVHVHDELVAVPAAEHLVGGLHDRVGERVPRAGRFPCA